MSTPRVLPPLILVIDDEPEICEIVQVNLEAAGYRVSLAYDGMAGLRSARAQRPDLIILDVLMPGMDGWEVLRELAADVSADGACPDDGDASL